jgi:hypothetical protein
LKSERLGDLIAQPFLLTGPSLFVDRNGMNGRGCAYARMKKAGALATGFFHDRENPACQSWEQVFIPDGRL